MLQIAGSGVVVMDQHTDDRPGLGGHPCPVPRLPLRRQEALQGVHPLPRGRARRAEGIIPAEAAVEGAEHQPLQIPGLPAW